MIKKILYGGLLISGLAVFTSECSEGSRVVTITDVDAKTAALRRMVIIGEALSEDAPESKLELLREAQGVIGAFKRQTLTEAELAPLCRVFGDIRKRTPMLVWSALMQAINRKIANICEASEDAVCESIAPTSTVTQLCGRHTEKMRNLADALKRISELEQTITAYEQEIETLGQQDAQSTQQIARLSKVLHDTIAQKRLLENDVAQLRVDVADLKEVLK